MQRLVIVLIGLVGLMVVIGVRVGRMRVPVETENPDHLTIDIPQGSSYGAGSGRQVDISPDGKQIAYVGRPSGGNRRLYIQSLGEAGPREVPATQNALDPTFSPDGRYIAFYAEGTVKKVDLISNEISPISRLPGNVVRGIAWLDADTLIVGNARGALLRVTAAQSEALEIRPANLVGPQASHLHPAFLPGKKVVLCTVSSGPLSNARIAAVNMESGEEHALLDENAYAPRFVPTGHLIFARGFDRRLMAVRFDAQKLEAMGTPVSILDMRIAGQGSGGSTDYSVSETGSLVYTPRHEESIDDVFAEISNLNLMQIHIQTNWFEELQRAAP
jgi:eukaryotic-like serine/threonine-protein kinase